MNIHRALGLAEDFRRYASGSKDKKLIEKYSLQEIIEAQSKLIGPREGAELYVGDGEWYKAMIRRIGELSEKERRRDRKRQVKSAYPPGSALKMWIDRTLYLIAGILIGLMLAYLELSR
jgi:hypothetical protein